MALEKRKIGKQTVNFDPDLGGAVVDTPKQPSKPKRRVSKDAEGAPGDIVNTPSTTASEQAAQKEADQATKN